MPMTKFLEGPTARKEPVDDSCLAIQLRCNICYCLLAIGYLLLALEFFPSNSQ